MVRGVGPHFCKPYGLITPCCNWYIYIYLGIHPPMQQLGGSTYLVQTSKLRNNYFIHLGWFNHQLIYLSAPHTLLGLVFFRYPLIPHSKKNRSFGSSEHNGYEIFASRPYTISQGTVGCTPNSVPMVFSWCSLDILVDE